jgi:hypothetical protein
VIIGVLKKIKRKKDMTRAESRYNMQEWQKILDTRENREERKTET